MSLVVESFVMSVNRRALGYVPKYCVWNFIKYWLLLQMF